MESGVPLDSTTINRQRSDFLESAEMERGESTSEKVLFHERGKEVPARS